MFKFMSSHFVIFRSVPLLPLLLAFCGTLHAQVNCPTQCKGDCGGLPLNEQGKCITQCEIQCEKKNAPPPPITLTPKYLILALIYAPPGCTGKSGAGCGTPSSVDYSSQSSQGTKISTKDSFKEGVTVTASIGSSVLGSNVSAGYTATQTDSDTVTLTKTAGLDVKVNANGDGIDHGQDQFILLLNPTVTLSKVGGNVYWTPGYSGPAEIRYSVYVSELRDPSTMRADVAQELKNLNFTDDDYQAILSFDPYGGRVQTPTTTHAGIPNTVATVVSTITVASTGQSGPTLDGSRFSILSWNFPYEPADLATDCNGGVCSCLIFQGNLKNDYAEDNGSEQDYSYTVSAEASAGVKDVWGLKVSTDLTWSTSATTDNTKGSTQSATAAISCPSPTYAGPTNVQLYWDKLFGTFMFVLEDYSPTMLVHQGKVTDSSGKPVNGQLVELTYGGITYHTVTARDGSYRFYAIGGKSGGETLGGLSVGAVKQQVRLGAAEGAIVKVK